MIDIILLRKLGNEEVPATREMLLEACLEAADTIKHLCQQIDGCVRVAADALRQAKS